MQKRYELQAMTEQLQDYLMDGNSVYKTITARDEQGDNLIKMSIGGMLDRIADLQGSGEASQVAEEALEALQRERRSQPDNFWTLVGREAKATADSWEWYLQNLTDGEEQAIRDFPTERSIRTRLQRLLDIDEEQPTLNEERRRAEALDERLQEMWRAERKVPEGEYWWLHGAPQAPADL